MINSLFSPQETVKNTVPDFALSEFSNGELLAAVDLGSNSFHMIVARYEHGELRIIDRLRDSVRLAAGLSKDGKLDAERQQRALTCLAKFGQRLRALPSERVRAVATNAVRRLSTPSTFLRPAEEALGHPIEVVSGREEARLTYLGVAHGLAESSQRRLVIDIGGGSTEFILGQGLEALEKESLQLGCVASTMRFFADGKLNLKRWHAAQTEISMELQQFSADYRAQGWSEAIGSSGTIRSIGNIIQTAGWAEEGITRTALIKVRDAMLEAGSIEQIRLPGLQDDRTSIIAGGVAILEAAFNALNIQQMQVCDTAMREGLLYDMIGRAEHRDPRDASISALEQRYSVDRLHAKRVENTVVDLFEQTATNWELTANHKDWLIWAARIHEIGLAIAHSQYHIHGAYIVENSDLAGFGRHEQRAIAALIRCHRRKPDKNLIQELPERLQRSAYRSAALLRLAVLLHRARSSDPLPKIKLQAKEKLLQLTLSPDWLKQHPLTQADLEHERDYLKALDIKMQPQAHVL